MTNNKEKVLKRSRPSDEQFDLNQHLPFRIAVVGNLLQLDRDPDLKALSDLRLREIRALVDIGSFGPIKASEISKLSRIDAFTISRATKTLVEDGYAKMTDDPLDKRSPHYSLTAKGQKLYKKVTQILIERSEQIEDSLAPGELPQLLDMLERLENAAERLLADKARHALSRGDEISQDQRTILRQSKAKT